MWTISRLCPRAARARRSLFFRPVVLTLEERIVPSSTLSPASGYGQIPLSFEANQGQAPAGLDFVAHGSGYSIGLTPTASYLGLSGGANGATATLQMELVGSNLQAGGEGLGLLPGTSNYFVGSDASEWHTNIPTFGQVAYQNVYAGIGVIYHGNQRQLEYDFVVAPGADPSAIHLRFNGATGLTLDGQGDLVVHSSGGDLVEQAPVLYQDGLGGRQTVAGGYVLDGDNQVHFQAGGYDTSRALVIDPVLSYSTYLGGSGDDRAEAVAVDGAGNVYVTGATGSSNFPVTPGALQTTLGTSGGDGFVAKVNPAGTAYVYVTYLGGNANPLPVGIAVDAAGNAFVTGFTGSGYPVTPGAAQTVYGGNLSDAFVTKLNATGNALVYSTYLGGPQEDFAQGIALDAAGNAYICGDSRGGGLPVTAGAFQTTYGGGADDGFVAKLNTTGTAFSYVTYLGGPGQDFCAGIAVDAAGNAYVNGVTQAGFPVTAGAAQTTYGGGPSDAFVSKLNATGTALIYSSYLGGSGQDQGFGIALDSANDAYVTGFTSGGFPVTPGAAQTGGGSRSGFVAEINAAGTQFLYATYLGSGSGNGTEGFSLTVDPIGDAYVAGEVSNAGGIPTTPGAPQPSYGGGFVDGFVAELNPTGTAFLFGTYLGGPGDDQAVGIARDTTGNLYVVGTAGAGFPTTAGALQSTFGGGSIGDGFIAKYVPGTDLAITNDDGVSSVLQGGQTTYTIVVSNNGPDSVANAPVMDMLPAAAASATWNATATVGSSVAMASGVGSINTTVSLLVGGSVTFTYTVTLNPAATGTLVNTATVLIPNGLVDPNPANNTATDTDNIVTPTTTVLASSANPVTFGQSVTFTATLTTTTPGVPVGTITFMDGATTLGSVSAPFTQTGPMTFTATFTTSSLSGGNHTIKAVYSGDTNFQGSMSAPLTETVNPAPTTTAVVSSVNPANFGQSVTFTATLTTTTAGAPTGTLTFMDGGTRLGTANVPFTQTGSMTFTATFSTSSLSAGNHTIRAVYNGDKNFQGSMSLPLTETVNAPPAPPLPPTTVPTLIAVGSDAGILAEVKVFDAATDTLKFDLFPFGSFVGGVHVAVGDVNGDGIPDIVVGAGPGGGPQVRVYDGKTGQPFGGPLGSFYGLTPSTFTGGVFVAVGDVNGDRFGDVIVGADAGGGPEVEVFSGKDGSVLIAPFYALASSFTGGVRVAAGDVDGDGKADIIAAAGPGALPQVTVFRGTDLKVLQSFFAFPTEFGGGVYVAAGDLDGDRKAEVIAGAGPGGGPEVAIFSGGVLQQAFDAFDPRPTDVLTMDAVGGEGVRVGTTIVGGHAAILTGPGPGPKPLMDVFNGQTLALLDSFFAFDPAFRGGVFVAG